MSVYDPLDRYWFARGYYDGRSDGRDQRPDGLADGQKHAYRAGYELGVIDYCEIDARADEEVTP